MKAVGAAPVLLFSDHVLQPVLLYWYDVYNTLFFFLFLFGKKSREAVKATWEMSILSLCNHLHRILELNG